MNILQISSLIVILAPRMKKTKFNFDDIPDAPVRSAPPTEEESKMISAIIKAHKIKRLAAGGRKAGRGAAKAQKLVDPTS